MSLVTSILGSVVGMFLPDRSYWAVKFKSGKFACELDQRFEQRSGLMRPFDWTLDLVDNSDLVNVKELWLFCPPTPSNPMGSSACLPITESYTAFHLKIGNVNAFGSNDRRVVSQLIGRVDDKVSGDCTCFIWDADLRVMSAPYKTNLYDFAPWREGIAPIRNISHEVMGLRL